MQFARPCIPCFLGQLQALVKRATKDPALQLTLTNDILSTLAQWDFQVTPPSVAGQMLRCIRGRCGDLDLYQEEKERSTQLATEILRKAQPMLDASKDPFGAYLRLTCGGNIIDFGVNEYYDLEQTERRVLEVLSAPVPQQNLDALQNAIEKAHRILYVLDNCGEAVFDAAFIRKFLLPKVTIACRGGNVLNDVTQNDLAPSGLDGIPFVTTGDLCPGAVPETSSKEFQTALHEADIVIAKGQGNFESMSSYSGHFFFLFRVKCPVVADFIHAPMFSIQIAEVNQ